jgi:hypothetical protein
VTRRKALIVSILVGGLASVVPLVASWRWTADTRALEDRLKAPSARPAPHIPVRHVSQLPPPVERYLQHVLGQETRRIVRARAEQDAEFFINGAWQPLHATQQFSVAPAGFVWDARIRMARFVTAFVRDSFVNDEGSMRAALNALYPLVDQHGRSELDAGALQRLLGESLWLPTMLKPGHGVAWTELSDSSAVATLSAGGTHVSLEFRFNQRNEVSEIVGQRFAEQDGEYQLRPWHVACGEYGERHGLLIPIACEVAWLNGERLEPYWRGRIVEITYEFAGGGGPMQ